MTTTVTTTTAAAEVETLRRKRNRKRALYIKTNKRITNIARSEKMRRHFEEHPEARRKLSRTMRKYWNNPEWKARVLAIKQTDEYKRKHSMAMKKAFQKKKELR